MSKFISFDQWLKDNPELVQQMEEDEGKSQDCHICRGKGCCGTCGYPCQACSGAAMRTELMLRAIYADKKEEQRKKLKAWTEALRSLSDTKAKAR